MIVRELRRSPKGGHLTAFVTLETPSGLIIHDCRVFEKQGRRWIGLPSRSYKREDGSTAYTDIIKFVSKDIYDRFQSEALEAIACFESADREGDSL
jgi:DNA-binding cell septation regulator SpoVG